MERIILRFEGEANGDIRVLAHRGGRQFDHVVPRNIQEQIDQVAMQLMGRFEGPARPLVDPVSLRELGGLLHKTYLKPLPAEFFNADGDATQILISSGLPNILNLPMEALADGGDFFIEGAMLGIRRTRRPVLNPPSNALVPRPLRILFSACAPTNLNGLDYEKEEEAILRIADKLGGNIHLDIAEAGTLDELRELISELRPHVVHLSGHGVLRNGLGHFAFEDERGKSDDREAHDMAQQLFAGRSVRLVFVSGCQTGQASAASVCEALTAQGHVPLVLGWGASIADDLATEFARIFFHELASGQSVDRSVSIARRELFARCRIRQGPVDILDASFALPRLYASEDANHLIDPKLPPEKPSRPGVKYELLGDNIRGLREGFVGRRRVLQRTRPALRVGDIHVLLLTGIGGAGKSTLATRLANRAKQDGFRIVALRANRNEPTSFCLRLLGELAAACQRLGREADERMLRDGQRPLTDRLRLAIEVLNEAKILLVLDNLEELLAAPPAAPTWTDPDFAAFFSDLTSRLIGEGRAILTCRYVPQDFDPNQPNLRHEPMPDFTEAEFFKYLRRHTRMADRIDKGELTQELLTTFHRKLGATPRFIEQSAAILGVIEPDRLHEQLAGIDDPDHNAPDDEIWQLQQKCFSSLFLPQLYETLSPEFRLAISRLAVVELPIPLDGVAKVAGFPEARASEAVNQWLCHGLLQRFGESEETLLYAIYPLQRSFFTDPSRLSAQERQASHQAAATFLQVSFERNREAEIGLHPGVELFSCLEHAKAANDRERTLWSATRLARGLHLQAEFRVVIHILEPLLKGDRHPQLLVEIAYARGRLGEWKAARLLYEEAIALFRSLGDKQGEAGVWKLMATIDVSEGNYDAARAKLARSVTVNPAIGDGENEIDARNELAAIDIHQGNYLAAREKLEKLLASLETIGDSASATNVLHNLAMTYLKEGDYRTARDKFAKILVQRQALGDRAGEAAALHELAAIDSHEGNYVAARQKFEKSRTINQTIGSSANEAADLNFLGTIELMGGNYIASQEYFSKALALRQSIGDRVGEANTFGQIGRLALSKGRKETALHLTLLCWFIEESLHHESQETLQAAVRMSADLQLTKTQARSTLLETMQLYARDRGASLVAEAFAGLENQPTTTKNKGDQHGPQLSS